MSRRAFNSLLAMFALQGAASAADLPAQKASPAPLMFSWEGGYLGTQAGYGFNTVSEHGFDPIPGYAGLANPFSFSQNYSSRGFFNGFHFGYNKQFGQFVLGAEVFHDITGQSTGFKTSYFNYAMGSRHWFTPAITIRPEVAFYSSLKTPAFSNGTQSHATIFSADLIWHC